MHFFSTKFILFLDWNGKSHSKVWTSPQFLESIISIMWFNYSIIVQKKKKPFQKGRVTRHCLSAVCFIYGPTESSDLWSMRWSACCKWSPESLVIELARDLMTSKCQDWESSHVCLILKPIPFPLHYTSSLGKQNRIRDIKSQGVSLRDIALWL